MTMTRHEVLLALGPGGTTDVADRVHALLEAQAEAWFKATYQVLQSTELGGLAEVCELLGESRQTVGHWISGQRSPDPLADPFPEPLVRLKATPVYDLKTIREWAETAGLSVLGITREVTSSGG